MERVVTMICIGGQYSGGFTEGRKDGEGDNIYVMRPDDQWEHYQVDLFKFLFFLLSSLLLGKISKKFVFKKNKFCYDSKDNTLFMYDRHYSPKSHN